MDNENNVSDIYINHGFINKDTTLIMAHKYSFLVGLAKSFKNTLVVLAPMILAILAGLPVEYSPVAGFLAYLIKNYITNK